MNHSMKLKSRGNKWIPLLFASLLAAGVFFVLLFLFSVLFVKTGVPIIFAVPSLAALFFSGVIIGRAAAKQFFPQKVFAVFIAAIGGVILFLFCRIPYGEPLTAYSAGKAAVWVLSVFSGLLLASNPKRRRRGYKSLRS